MNTDLNKTETPFYQHPAPIMPAQPKRPIQVVIKKRRSFLMEEPA